MSHKNKRDTLQHDLEQAAWTEMDTESAVPENAEAAAVEIMPEETPVDQDAALAAAKAQAEEYLTLAQRVQADFDNFRKRNEKIRADSFQEGKREAVSAMLPVLDNMERALQAAADAPEEGIRAGVEMILRQMQSACTSLGVTPIDRKGEKFDPNLEEAVMQGTEDEGEPGTVCQVFQKGYAMGTTVLRHAMVKVVAE